MADLPATVLLGLAVLILLLSSAGALAMRSTLAKLHFVTPVSSLAMPLVAAAYVVQNGWSTSTGLVVLIAAIAAATGPVLEIAIARVHAEAEGLEVGESPE